jgi:hypothetical protein
MIYFSERSFSVFSYDISHGLLLLRSGKTNDYNTRIDILFKDVVAIESRMKINKILIKIEDPSFISNAMSKSSLIIEPGHKVYSLTSDDWVGFIVGGMITVHEDNEDFFKKSFLL